MAQAFGVGDDLDFGDLSVCKCEAEHELQVATRGYDDAHSSVHECWLRLLGSARELLGYGCRATKLLWRAQRHLCRLEAEHNVRVKHGEEGIEVTGTRGREEGANNFSLAREVTI